MAFHEPGCDVEAHAAARLRPEIALVRLLGPRDAEVDELYAAFVCEQEVARIDVAVRDPLGVDVRECAKDLVCQGLGDHRKRKRVRLTLDRAWKFARGKSRT